MSDPYSFPDSIVKNPLTMLCFYDEDIQRGIETNGKEGVTLSKWQKDLLVCLGQPHKYLDVAIQSMLLAANGSGKSQYILAPFAIWMGMRFNESLTIITTASGNQLDAQDLRYCTRLAQKINKFHEKEFPEGVIECQYRKLKNKVTESYLNMFATDETGKAEGWHPIKPDGKFAIIIDEGKTVNDEIYEAIENCTGFTHRVDISSAGKSSGAFYTNWHNRDIDSFVKKYRVTAFDCGHIPHRDIEQRIKKYGAHHPRIRNSIYSEFTSADQQVVIPRELLLKSTMLCKTHYSFGHLRAGLDLAAGGDENSISVWDGNKEIASKSWKKSDTVEAVGDIIEFIHSFKGALKAENIYADDSGVGRPMLDLLRAQGFSVNRILNQTRAFDTSHYANRGTELWFNFKRFVEEYQVLFAKGANGDVDPVLLAQMSNRYYKVQDATGKIILESKQKAKAEGHPSPDRADAVILAWSPYIYPLDEIMRVTHKVEVKGKTIEEIHAESVNRELYNLRMGIGNAKEPKREYTPQQMGMSNVLTFRNIFKSIRNR